jgi:hypothetical protein
MPKLCKAIDEQALAELGQELDRPNRAPPPDRPQPPRTSPRCSPSPPQSPRSTAASATVSKTDP